MFDSKLVPFAPLLAEGEVMLTAGSVFTLTPTIAESTVALLLSYALANKV